MKTADVGSGPRLAVGIRLPRAGAGHLVLPLTVERHADGYHWTDRRRCVWASDGAGTWRSSDRARIGLTHEAPETLL